MNMTIMIITGIVAIVGLCTYIYSLKKDLKTYRSAFEWKREQFDELYEELKEVSEELYQEKNKIDRLEKDHEKEIVKIKDTAQMPLLRKELEQMKYQSTIWLKENLDKILSTMDVTITLYRGVESSKKDSELGRWWSTDLSDAQMYANNYDESIIYKATFDLKAKDYQGFLFIYDEGHETHMGWGAIPQYLTGSGDGNWFYINPCITPVSIQVIKKQKKEAVA